MFRWNASQLEAAKFDRYQAVVNSHRVLPAILFAPWSPSSTPSDEQARLAMSDTDHPTGEVRKIIHVDMDAFYASVEQRDNPELRGKPVAVGGSRERGVVAAASYEARKFGVRSAMPSVTAKRQCPDLIFVKPRFDVYKAVSLQIRDDLRRVHAARRAAVARRGLSRRHREPARASARATTIAQEIRARIRAETGLTASAGVSYNKFLAKLASDHRKPDGLFVITPEMGPGLRRDAAGRQVPRHRPGDGARR